MGLSLKNELLTRSWQCKYRTKRSPLRTNCVSFLLMTSFYFSFNEVWRGRESFSDKKARTEAIESLKKMIKSWLDDTFPEMPEMKRVAMAESMDVSMVERKKEESMKTFYEINNVIRMSFIEMQYMKKVRFASYLLTSHLDNNFDTPPCCF